MNCPSWCTLGFARFLKEVLRAPRIIVGEGVETDAFVTCVEAATASA
jgi:hypothetical protein